VLEKYSKIKFETQQKWEGKTFFGMDKPAFPHNL
jgi:hypothetical protein